jgi:hypothetical protein
LKEDLCFRRKHKEFVYSQAFIKYSDRGLRQVFLELRQEKIIPAFVL